MGDSNVNEVQNETYNLNFLDEIDFNKLNSTNSLNLMNPVTLLNQLNSNNDWNSTNLLDSTNNNKPKEHTLSDTNYILSEINSSIPTDSTTAEACEFIHDKGCACKNVYINTDQGPMKRLKFINNPAIRIRTRNRLIKKLENILYELHKRVGEEAAVALANPNKPQYHVCGSTYLRDILKSFEVPVLSTLQTKMQELTQPSNEVDTNLYLLPPLVVDGIVAPLDKMNQVRLRKFIPHLIKCSTRRRKVGWGFNSSKPPWWPDILPFKNIRLDCRTAEQKKKLPWTKALQTVVYCCYKYHNRLDLLSGYEEFISNELSIENQASLINNTVSGAENANFENKTNLEGQTNEVAMVQVVSEKSDALTVTNNDVFEITAIGQDIINAATEKNQDSSSNTIFYLIPVEVEHMESNGAAVNESNLL